MWLMRKNKIHLGLEDKPECRPQGTAAAVKAEHKQDLAAWLEQKDTCARSICKAVQSVPEALEIVEQYMMEKKFSCVLTLPTYATIVATCKRYDKALEQQRMNPVIGEAHTVSEKVVVLSYPKCGEKGHTATQSWLHKREQEKAKLKQAGRSKDFKKSHGESSKESYSRPLTGERSVCYMCRYITLIY